MKKTQVHIVAYTGILIVFALAACTPAASPAAPTVSNTATPESSPTSLAQNLGDCFNPFNPVSEGRTLTYRIQSSAPTEEFSIAYQNVTTSSFDSVLKFPDVSSTIQWSCSPDGLISSDFASLNMAQIPNVNIQTVDVSGVVFPTAEKWQVGYTWDLTFNVDVTADVSGDSIQGSGEIAISNTIAAIEPVSVPAGDYSEAYRVDASGSLKLDTLGVNTSIPVTYSSWYVKDVGMVKSSSDSSDTSYTIELISLN